MHKNTAARRRSRESGFTMLEVVTTVIITLILSSAMLPQFLGMANRAKLNGATRELVSDIMQTRMAAVAKNTSYRLAMVGGTGYAVWRDEDKDGTYEDDERIGESDFTKAYTGVTITASRDIDFSPKGTVVSATVELSNKSGSKKVTSST